MKTTALILAGILGTALASQGATLASTGNTQLDSATNWSPSQVPASGLDTLNVTANTLVIDSTWTIGSGQAINHTGGAIRLANNGHLTVASGGNLNSVGFYESGAKAAAGRSLTIEAGASVTTTRYVTGQAASAGDSDWTTKWIADASGISTLFITNDWRVRGSALEVDLSSYDISNGDTLILADYGTIHDLPFFNTTVTGDFTYTLETAFDQGGGDFAVALTNIVSTVPEPSSSALLGLGLSSLLLRRKRIAA